MQATLIEYMPAHLRDSHIEAGNRGVYPANGACRVWVAGEVDEEDLDGEWAGVIELGEPPEQDLPDVLEDVPLEAMAPVEEP